MIQSFLRDKLKISRTNILNNYYFYRLRKKYSKKISYIHNYLVQNNHNIKLFTQIDKHKRKWKILSKKINTCWYRTYSTVSQIENENYVPEDIYYGIIEPQLNDFSLSLAYADKNFYDKLYKTLDVFPEILLRNINGLFYSNNYEYLPEFQEAEKLLNSEDKIIVKPSLDSGGGRKVEIFQKKPDSSYYNNIGNKLSFIYLKKRFIKDFVIQKYIKSADYFSLLNKTSLNTVRIFTYRSVKTNEIIINHGVLRIGQKGADVDNQSSGGIACYIHEDGKLNDYAVDKYGNKYYNLPSDEGKRFYQLDKVPKFEEMKNVAKTIAEKNLYHRLLGMDFCVDERNNVKLIEINNQEAEINFFQMFGKPLFKDYTDEVIQYCSKTNKLF